MSWKDALKYFGAADGALLAVEPCAAEYVNAMQKNEMHNLRVAVDAYAQIVRSAKNVIGIDAEESLVLTLKRLVGMRELRIEVPIAEENDTTPCADPEDGGQASVACKVAASGGVAERIGQINHLKQKRERQEALERKAKAWETVCAYLDIPKGVDPGTWARGVKKKLRESEAV